MNANFRVWLAGAAAAAKKPFTAEQIRWLEMIRDHIAANLGIEPEDFEYAPFAQQGGLGRVYQLFGERLPDLLETLNDTLAA